MSENKIISTPRALKSQQTKDKIYQAALQLLKQYGYEYITVSNICHLAEVSTGSFYHFFDSKDTLMANFFYEAYEKMPREEKTFDNPIDEIIEGLCFYSEFCQSQGLDFIRHFYTPFNKAMDSRHALNANGKFDLPLLADAGEKIKKYISSGYLKSETDPYQLANDLCTIEKGIIFEWCTSDGSFTIKDKTHLLLSNYVKAFVK